MDARHRFFAEALRANFSLAQLLGLSANEVIVIAEAELRKQREDIARAHNPEPDGA